MQFRTIYWTFLSLVSVANLAAEHARVLLWQVDLRKTLGSRAGELPSDAPIYALRFSPDGHRIAVVVGGNGFLRDGEQQNTDRLLILDVRNPEQTLTPVAVQHGVDDNRDPNLAFGWSPSGALINVGGTLVDARSERTCALPYDGLFIANDQVMGPYSIGPWSSGQAHFHFYDSRCAEVGDWSLSESWSLQRASQDGKEVSMQIWAGSGPQVPLTPPPPVPTQVVDPNQKRVLQHWGDVDWDFYNFIDHGREICSGGIPESLKSKDPVKCWSVATGKVVAKSEHIRGGSPLQTSADSTRLVATDYTVLWAPWNEDGYEVHPRRRVLWDFRTDKELASWKPPMQKYVSRDATPKPTEDAFRFALSPDGNLLAEGGNGILQLYRIAPSQVF